jgi:hypothetical protein
MLGNIKIITHDKGYVRINLKIIILVKKIHNLRCKFVKPRNHIHEKNFILHPSYTMDQIIQ